METSFRCPYCGRARDAAGTCSACGAEAPAVPCRRCGQAVPAPLDRCRACGAPCDAWRDAAEHELSCPRCSGRLERVEVDSVHVEQCARCLGCFVRTEDFSELVRQEEGGQRMDLRFAPTAGRELPRQTLLALIRCPHCAREMDRARFAQRAELVVDVCAAHGLWLDAGELGAILTFVKDRVEGHASPSAAEREEQQRWSRIDRMRAEEALFVDYHASRAEDAQRQPHVGTVVAATAIAGPWAGLFFALRGMTKRR